MSLLSPLWKIDNNYFNDDSSLMSDEQCEFLADTEAAWRKSLPHPAVRSALFPLSERVPQVAELMSTPSLDWRTVRTNLSVPHILDSFTLTRRRDYGCKSTFCCPWHEETTASLSFSHDKKVFFCFGCNAKGSVFDFVMKMNDCSFGEAIRYCDTLS